jgi:hypothetical protein
VDALDAVVVLNHVADPHVLVRKDRMGAHEGERRLVVTVLPLATRLLMRRRQEDDRLAAPVAALLAPRDAAQILDPRFVW